MVVTRFSPSPTGKLHVGNVRTALVNYLFTKKLKGKLILRIDDTDLERSQEHFTEQIISDLKWLGINWDEMFKQSGRLEYYEEIKNNLLEKGIIYPCYETEEELNIQRKIQLSRGVPPVYDRNSLKLTKEEISEKINQGIKPYYRFLLDDDEVSWNDGIRGKITFKSRAFSDPVVIRENGSPTYVFCSVIDDAAYNITDIIRGEDHISNTAVQIKMLRSMGKEIPNFYHLSLLKTKEGEMSKRTGGFDVGSLKENGIDPMTINSLLAKLGSSDNVEPFSSLGGLIDGFSMDKFSAGAINYNENDVFNLNRKIISKKTYDEVASCLDNLGIKNITKDFWESIRENITSYSDVRNWYEIFYVDFKPSISDSDMDFLKVAADILPDNVTSDNFKSWVSDISSKTGRKGKGLYHPLRLALTNKDSGPELSKIIPMLGSEKVKQRLLCK